MVVVVVVVVVLLLVRLQVLRACVAGRGCFPLPPCVSPHWYLHVGCGEKQASTMDGKDCSSSLHTLEVDRSVSPQVTQFPSNTRVPNQPLVAVSLNGLFSATRKQKSPRVYMAKAEAESCSHAFYMHGERGNGTTTYRTYVVRSTFKRLFLSRSLVLSLYRDVALLLSLQFLCYCCCLLLKSRLASPFLSPLSCFLPWILVAAAKPPFLQPLRRAQQVSLLLYRLLCMGAVRAAGGQPMPPVETG